MLTCLGFEYHGKAGPKTKYIIYGGEHNVDAKVEDHYNFKKGPGQVRISMLDLNLSQKSSLSTLVWRASKNKFHLKLLDFKKMMHF